LEFADQYRTGFWFTAITYNVNSFALYAPSGATLSGSSATEIQFQGPNDGVNWTVRYSTTTVGSVGEVITSISSNLTAGNYRQHRIAIQSQGQPIAVAQAQFNVATTGRRQRGMRKHPRAHAKEKNSASAPGNGRRFSAPMGYGLGCISETAKNTN
jgi:hypothetical protein